MLQKLIRQYGEHGNEYSPVEVGDKINEIIDYLFPEERIAEIIEKNTNGVVEPIVQDGIVARSPSTSDMVYLIKGDKKHWVKNPETLKGLGFNFQDVKNITNEEMGKYESGESINLKDQEPLEVSKPKDGFDIYDI